MALDKASLVQAIKDLSNLTPDDAEEVHDEMANALADAIDTYAKTGTVTVSSGSSAGTYPLV